MFSILRNKFLKPLHSLTPKSLITPFCSSSNSSEPKPNSTAQRVIDLLRSHGLTETQISKLTQVRPMILSANPDKSIAPKLDFLLSIGIPKTHLPKLVCNTPPLLWRSLEDQLIPCHNFLKTVVANHESLTQMLMGKSRILLYDVHTRIAPNINLLTQIGVPKTLISSMLLRCPNVICDNHAEFSRSVKLVIGMEFNPVKYVFIAAIKVLTELSTTTWDSKVMAFKSWGFSDKEVAIAFRMCPLSMNLSEEKLSKIMDIFVNEMGRKPAEVARYPNILNYSVENRIKPRCRVIKVLISEGLLRKTILLQTFLRMKELQFLEKFVSKYKDEVPHLLNIYQERQIV